MSHAPPPKPAWALTSEVVAKQPHLTVPLSPQPASAFLPLSAEVSDQEERRCVLRQKAVSGLPVTCIRFMLQHLGLLIKSSTPKWQHRLSIHQVHP